MRIMKFLRAIVVAILSAFRRAKWHHIVTVVDEDGKPRMYVNGSPCHRSNVFDSQLYFSCGCWIKTNK